MLVVAACALPLGLGAHAATKACTAGPIVCENQLAGVAPASWLPGAGGDPSIQGFSTDISVNHGQTISFKVKTPATGYRIDIFRLGWYGGLGSRLVTTIAPSATLPQVQPACTNDAATGLVDCGNWAVSASWAVPADAVSGIYIAHLVRTDNARDSAIYFVVRDDERHADLLFQTSDSTWQAYNAYGGNSLYVGQPAGRAYKVSYNRPLTVRDTSARNSPLYSEWPMLQWLERNGYDVSYATDVDTARSGAELLEHKAFLSVGHDEYWSAEQRQSVTAARNAGVDLAFFSGNESYWKTRWESSFRTLVSYKESQGGVDPSDPPTSTGTWRDPRFAAADGGKPENALSGTIFTVNALRDDAISVPAQFTSLRFWRNALTPGQAATLPTGTLGYEWDSDLDNGSRPGGLIDLSSTTLSAPQVVTDAAGVNTGPGTATHSLTLYRAASGALVFGAGTVQWSFGLSALHDGAQDTTSPPADRRMQQATLNLLAEMGGQPTTMQSDLVAATASTDTTAPTAAITSPADSALLTTGHAITITGTAADTGGLVAGVEISTDGGQSWHPATGTTSWSYVWTPTGFGARTIVARATDDSVNMGNPSPGVTVTLGQCPCTIFGNSTPTIAASTDNASYELGVRFRSDATGFVTAIRFYKGIGNGGTHLGRLWTNTGTLLGTATFLGETATGWQQASFATPIAVTAGTVYVASYTDPQGHYAVDRPAFAAGGINSPPLHALADGVSGANGVFSAGPGFPTRSFQASNYWVDVVLDASPADTNPPTVQAVDPGAGTSDVDPATAVTATFSEPLAAGSVTATSVLLKGPGGAVVPATVSYGSSTVTLAPSAPLQASTSYTATIKGGAGGVTDVAGNPLAADYTWSFTSSGGSGPCPCTFWTAADTPVTAAAADPNPYELGLRFHSDQAGSITGLRFYKGAGNTGTHAGHLWTATGTLLGTVTFTGESATGWQQASFAAPIAITAGTPYVVSYFAPNGRFAVDRPFFAAAGLDRGPLHAPAGANGVYSNGGGFPDQSFQSSNYWVDPIFTTVGAPPPPPPPPPGGCPCSLFAASATPGTAAAADTDAYELGVKFTSDVAGSVTAIRFYKGAGNGGTHVGHLWTAAGTQLGTVTFTGESATGWQQATFATPIAITPGTTYVASYFAPQGHFAVDRPYFATSGVDNAPLHAPSGANGVYGAGGGFPSAGYQSSNYWVDVVMTTSAAPPPSPPPPTTCPCTVFAPTSAPANPASTDTGAYELGVRFKADRDGVVSGIRFYKGTGNGGTHVGHLWTATGTLLGTVTFTGESATGWQQADFATAIAVTAGTIYVASYFDPQGHYAADRPYFELAGVDNAPLHALASDASGPNGVYAADGGFPSSSYQATNYWVDVVFS